MVELSYCALILYDINSKENSPENWDQINTKYCVYVGRNKRDRKKLKVKKKKS